MFQHQLGTRPPSVKRIMRDFISFASEGSGGGGRSGTHVVVSSRQMSGVQLVQYPQPRLRKGSGESAVVGISLAHLFSRRPNKNKKTGTEKERDDGTRWCAGLLYKTPTLAASSSSCRSHSPPRPADVVAGAAPPHASSRISSPARWSLANESRQVGRWLRWHVAFLSSNFSALK